MSFRMAGRIGGRDVRLLLHEGVNVVGSAAGCDLRVDHPTVSRTHAEVRLTEGRVEVRDLESRNGTFVAGRRVSGVEVTPGTLLAFGQVQFVLERVAAGDLTPAVSLENTPSAPAAQQTTEFNTVRTKPLETFTVEKLPVLVDLLAAGADRARLAQAAGSALFDTLPVLAVEVGTPGAGGAGVLFVARREAPGSVARPLTAGGDDLSLSVTFPEASMLEAFGPLVHSVATLVRLAGGGAVTAAPRGPQPARLPEPPSVAAEVQGLYAEAARVARGDVGVLITGESGTGKEVLARYVHAASPRAQASFVALNCAALPRDLLEAELFGIERGVATGVEARAGKFELAHGGTLFLDEIGDMALETQAKILRVLQEKTVHRIGGGAARQADVRVVAATNRDLQALRAQRAFREDLYYRIATWTVDLPPLRRRRADIPNLAVHFLSREAARLGVRVHGISHAAVDVLVRYEWPGNVRQLENEMARCVLFLGDGELLDTARLSPHLVEPPGGAPPSRLAGVLQRAERQEIEQALGMCGGDVARAAASLGLPKSTLYRRMKALGLKAAG